MQTCACPLTGYAFYEYCVLRTASTGHPDTMTSSETGLSKPVCMQQATVMRTPFRASAGLLLGEDGAVDRGGELIAVNIPHVTAGLEWATLCDGDVPAQALQGGGVDDVQGAVRADDVVVRRALSAR